MTVLRKGDRGQAVKELQNILNKNDANVAGDGVFGYQTDMAVRQFQRRNNLHVDGIVGRKTFAAMGLPVASRAPQPPVMGSAGRQAIGAMSVSSSGMTFLYHREAWANKSCYLHWPRGASGVTLGPGYDMKTRTPQEVKATMMSIGLDETTAAKIGEAATLTDKEAEAFAKNNKSLVKLTQQQETELLRVTVPPYINSVKNQIFVSLTQYEFDALVSFAYNPGGRLTNVCNYINNGQVSDAMTEIKRAITSKGEVLQGLVNRRRFEVELYLNGTYGA